MTGINYSINLNNSAFENTVNLLIQNNSVEEIIETGTFNGLGSTTVFAKIKLPVTTIESCKQLHLMAKENLKTYNNVTLLYGSSSHIKHYRSVLHLKRDKHNVTISQDNRFAYCIFN